MYNTILNIYDEPLKQCGNEYMNSGSWNNQYKCSEEDGGAHQICINNISNKTPNFSLHTGQSNWSNKRNNDNHCVCLGAWSLYNAKLKNKSKKSNVLKCDAIPKISLSKKYVQKFRPGWNVWNGIEKPNQIVHGINSLVENCYKPNKKRRQSEKLRRNYCKLSKNVNSLKRTKLYSELCRNKSRRRNIIR